MVVNNELTSDVTADESNLADQQDIESINAGENARFQQHFQKFEQKRGTKTSAAVEARIEKLD